MTSPSSETTTEVQKTVGPPCCWCGSPAEGEILVKRSERPVERLPACGLHLWTLKVEKGRGKKVVWNTETADVPA